MKPELVAFGLANTGGGSIQPSANKWNTKDKVSEELTKTLEDSCKSN